MTPETLSAVHQAAFADTRGWTASEFAALLNQRGVILCGDARSFLLGRVIADEAEVLTLATAPEFQRQGLGLSVLSTFLGMAETYGAISVFLEVANPNKAAIALYNKADFQVVGQRPNYYTTTSGAKVGAQVMRLTYL